MLMTVAVVSLVNMLAPAAVRGIGGVPRRPKGLFDRDRTRRRVPAIAATALLLCTVGVGQAWAAEAPVKVDAAPMNNADCDAANWLRASSFLGNDFFYEIVLNGAMKDAGMAPFRTEL